MGLTTSSRKKNVVQKPNNQPTVETGCEGGQGSPSAVAPSEEEDGLVGPKRAVFPKGIRLRWRYFRECNTANSVAFSPQANYTH
jgi:hypothetical protein